MIQKVKRKLTMGNLFSGSGACFPPDWCSDVPHADSAEYKLWGNGIALPCLFNLFKAIVDVYEAEAEEHEESRLQSDTLLMEEVRDASDK